MRNRLVLVVLLFSAFTISGETAFRLQPELRCSFGQGAFTLSAGIDLAVGFPTDIGDVVPSVELFTAYHTNFKGFGEKGMEFRISPMVGVEGPFVSYALGTNWWFGTGELAKFRQRTGVASIAFNYFLFSRDNRIRFIYENDGVPFTWLFLSDTEDRYRTAAFRTVWERESTNEEFSLGLRLFTGNRVQGPEVYPGEVAFDSFGYRYPNGFVNEVGRPYRLSLFYLGYANEYMELSAGVQYDPIRHLIQDWVAHEIFSFSGNRGFPIYDDQPSLVLSAGIRLSPVLSIGEELLPGLHTAY